MRKIVAGFAVSVDGFIEGPNGDYDWIIIDKAFDFLAHMKRFDAFFMGRKTYEMVTKTGGGVMKNIKNYVFSNTLTEVKKGYTLINKDVIETVKELKIQEGKDIAIFGGADLLTSFLNTGLVDEISLSVIPIILGAGKPMFGKTNNRVALQLIQTQTLPSGTVILSYQVKSS